MSRLLVHVEGETEETFVNEVLAPSLYPSGYNKIAARILGNSRQRQRRGGIRGWDSVRGDILRHLREDRECLISTLVDYYALPSAGPGAWPGRAAAASMPFDRKATSVQEALATDITASMGPSFGPFRFLPFVVMHEFEGLLFSDCERFARGIGHPGLAAKLQEIRAQFRTPEEINDSPDTAPSKRVVALLPRYQKPFLGPLAALEIGLERIRAECPHFDRWVRQLEAWPAAFAAR